MEGGVVCLGSAGFLTGFMFLAIEIPDRIGSRSYGAKAGLERRNPL